MTLPMLDPWTPAQGRVRLRERLRTSRARRTARLDRQWELNERTVYNADGTQVNFTDTDEAGNPESGEPTDQITASTGTNYSFKNLRYIHAQMSANPPATIPRPSTSDPEDRRAARAADRVMRFALRQYGLQEKFDQTNLNCLLYGTGFLKTIWDTSKGDILGIRKNGQLVLEGDVTVKSVSPWRMFIDPDAETWEEVRYVFEEITVSREEALHRWPGKAELIEKLLKEKAGSDDTIGVDGDVVRSYLADRQDKFESITAYEYWEKGLPSNAMLGRHAVCLEDGRCLQPPRPSPFAFSPPPSHAERRRAVKTGRQPKRKPPVARLPYHIITDVDVPNRVWGKSFVEFEAPLQQLLNELDSVMLANLQAHAVARLILPPGLSVPKGTPTNSPWDMIPLTRTGDGNAADVKFMAPMQLPAALSELRSQTKLGIDDMAGVNEASFGQSQRETSGFQMQYAANQAASIRRRLFNKYVLLVESVYRAILDLTRKHWSTERSIQVLGREKAFEVVDLKGSDIDGGYDIVVEYGTSLSLDPLTRRQEIMALLPLLKEAGVPARIILSMMKLGELDVVDDLVMLADDRQREYFEEMIASDMYIAPQEMEDHENMIAYGLKYIMTTEFKYLEVDQKQMIKEHVKERAALAQQEAAAGGPKRTAPADATAGAAPGVPGQPANPASPAPAGAVSQPADLGGV